MQEKVIIVIPHYNEANRLRVDEIKKLIQNQSVEVVLVNDGSTDNTLDVLTKISTEHPSKIRLFDMPNNQGKAEAVRLGLLSAIPRGNSSIVGYIDADFATPAEEVLRVIDVLSKSEKKVAMASRVQLLGRNIERTYPRHILGRLFATMASLILQLRVYDTQCGCKFFKSDSVEPALQTPFQSRWIFDVELILRLTQTFKISESDFIEVPLNQWSDVKGSKLSKFFMFKSGFELISLWIKARAKTQS